jgi:hypothetical protein
MALPREAKKKCTRREPGAKMLSIVDRPKPEQ